MRIYYELRRAIFYRWRKRETILRSSIGQLIFLFVTSLSIQTFAYFQAASKFTLNANPNDENWVDMTKEFNLIKDMFALVNTIALIGLIVFALFTLYISLKRNLYLAKDEFKVKFYSGSSTNQLTIELVLRELITLPLAYAFAFWLASFFYQDLAAFFNWALPFVNQGDISIQLLPVFFLSFSVMLLIIIGYTYFFARRMTKLIREI